MYIKLLPRKNFIDLMIRSTSKKVFSSYAIKFFLLAVIVLLILSCRRATHIQGFDASLWKNDIKGCRGWRKQLYSLILCNKNLILGASENDILKWLGIPDAKDIYERNKKTYIYFVTPGSQCAGNSTKGIKIVLEFSALGKLYMIKEETI